MHTIVVAPFNLATIAVANPTGPQPQMATDDPGFTSAKSFAYQAVHNASESQINRSSVKGLFVTFKQFQSANGTRAYSA